MPKNIIPLNKKKVVVKKQVVEPIPKKKFKKLESQQNEQKVEESNSQSNKPKVAELEPEPSKKLGQYWTTNENLHNKIVEFICNNPSTILEPSCGRGDLIFPVQLSFPNAEYDLYEIDENLKFKIDKKNINFCNFLEKDVQKLYDTIVGNPPFVKTKKGNLAIDFVEKCYNLLDKNGELIFIVPADFFKLTSASKLLIKMMDNGSFTHIYHPEVENMFKRATINILIFRYEKNKKLLKKCIYNNITKNIINNDGILLFVDEGKPPKIFGDYFNIYVGMVTGKDDVYKQSFGNYELLVGKDNREKFIFAQTYPTKNLEIDKHLQENKKYLLERKIRKFNEDNWWEWGAPRNISAMEDYKGKQCIYLHNLTRKEEVAFEGKVEFIGGNLLMLIPKVEFGETNKSISEVIQHINSLDFRKNYMYAGRFKIGHRQIKNALWL